MSASRTNSDPSIGDVAGLDGDLDAMPRSAGYADGLEYAGFWIRLGAALIDGILLMIITMPLLVWIYDWGYYGDGKLIAGPADFLINWLTPERVRFGG